MVGYGHCKINICRSHNNKTLRHITSQISSDTLTCCCVYKILNIFLSLKKYSFQGSKETLINDGRNLHDVPSCRLHPSQLFLLSQTVSKEFYLYKLILIDSTALLSRPVIFGVFEKSLSSGDDFFLTRLVQSLLFSD